MSKEKEELENQIKLLQAKTDDLKKQKEIIEAKELVEKMEPYKELAILAHDNLCTYNHTDGCGWEYEIKDRQHIWHGSWSAHRQWLEKIKKMMDGEGRYGNKVDAKDIKITIETLISAKKDNKNFLWILKELAF